MFVDIQWHSKLCIESILSAKICFIHISFSSCECMRRGTVFVKHYTLWRNLKNRFYEQISVILWPWLEPALFMSEGYGSSLLSFCSAWVFGIYGYPMITLRPCPELFNLLFVWQKVIVRSCLVSVEFKLFFGHGQSFQPVYNLYFNFTRFGIMPASLPPKRSHEPSILLCFECMSTLLVKIWEPQGRPFCEILPASFCHTMPSGAWTCFNSPRAPIPVANVEYSGTWVWISQHSQKVVRLRWLW